MSLLKLPVEIISMIAALLRIDHLFNLGSACQHLRYIIQSDSICRVALQEAMFSAEAIEAQSTRAYAHAFRRLVKRREAVRSGQPYLVARVAWADHFIYTNGVLCYSMKPDTLRILDVHASAEEELAVRASSWLPTTIDGFYPSLGYRFSPLYYSEGILSCLLAQNLRGETSHWLVVLDITDKQLLTCHALVETQKLFVRNNREYLFYGTKSRTGADGTRKWQLNQFNIRQRKVTRSALTIWDFDGTDIGSNLCFEIFDNYFYCLSNKGRPYGQQLQWNSYYNVIRFPLRKPDTKYFEYPPPLNLWRRHSAEGPSDLRWNSLQLIRSEASGALYIYESRRECLRNNSQSQRTCYKKELCFERKESETSTRSSPGTARNQPTDGDDEDEEEDDNEDDDESYIASYTEPRPPESVHVGDNGSFGTMLPINECFIRSYIPSCETFVDITSNPPLATAETQQLRLRVRSKPDLDEGPASVGNQTIRNSADPAGVGNEEIDRSVEFWPKKTQPDPVQNILRDMLSVTSLVTELDWAMDERTLVYAAAGKGQFRPIVLVSFDPKIHLPSASQQSAAQLIHSTERAVLQNVNSQGM
ncbi:Fc.00g101620.m01.CDS01 [Cosmosporella sp. VM-42]